MKNFKKQLLAGFMLMLSAPLYAELAVIAHPDNPLMGISREELKDIYLGRVRTFPDGKGATPVDQSPGSAARDHFNASVLQMSEGKRRSHWSRLMFTGKGKPPQTLSGDAAVLDWIARHPDGVGYIRGESVSKRVKVLLILP